MGAAGRARLLEPLRQPQRLLGGVDGEHVVAGVEVQPGGLLVEPDQLDARRTVLQQVDALLVVLDRRLALALVRQRRADLAVQVGHALQVLLAAVPLEAVGPDADRLVHAAEPQRDVAELLADPHALGAALLRADRPGMAVVRGRLAVRVQARRRVAGLLEEAKRAAAHRVELRRRHAALAPERRGAPVVLGEQRHHLVGAVARAVLEEAADLEVLPGADRLREHPVGHVADQHVLEGHLAVAHERAVERRREDVLLLKRDQRAVEVAALGLRHARERALRERAPDHGRLLHQPPLERLERVEPRRQHRLDGVRQLGRLDRALLGDSPRHLLGEERVPAGALRHGRHDLLALRQQLADQLAAVLVAERAEHQLRGGAPAAAPARPAVEQLVARQAHQHQRRAHPLREVLDRVEHAVVGPVDVLEGDHERPPEGDRLDAAPQRREERLAHALRVVLHRGELRRDLDAQQAADQRGLAVRVLARLAHQVADVVAQLLPGLLGGVRLHDPALGAQHLAQGPEHDAAPVGKAAAGADGGRRRVLLEPSLELAQEPRLPDARLADHGDEVRAALAHDALVEAVERGKLLLAPDERRLAGRRHAAHRVLGDQARPPPMPARARPCPSAPAARAPSTRRPRRSRAWCARRR